MHFAHLPISWPGIGGTTEKISANSNLCSCFVEDGIAIELASVRINQDARITPKEDFIELGMFFIDFEYNDFKNNVIILISIPY